MRIMQDSFATTLNKKRGFFKYAGIFHHYGNGKNPYYELSASDNKQAILLDVGDRVNLSPAGQLMDSIQEAVMPVQEIEQTATPPMEDDEITN